jgi:hypothetical protein
MKKSADLGKIRQGPPPKLATCKFASNPPLFSQICHFFHKSAGFSEKTRGYWPQSCHCGMGGGDGLGRHLVPILFGVILALFANFEA